MQLLVIKPIRQFVTIHGAYPFHNSCSVFSGFERVSVNVGRLSATDLCWVDILCEMTGPAVLYSNKKIIEEKIFQQNLDVAVKSDKLYEYETYSSQTMYIQECRVNI